MAQQPEDVRSMEQIRALLAGQPNKAAREAFDNFVVAVRRLVRRLPHQWNQIVTIQEIMGADVPEQLQGVDGAPRLAQAVRRAWASFRRLAPATIQARATSYANRILAAGPRVGLRAGRSKNIYKVADAERKRKEREQRRQRLRQRDDVGNAELGEVPRNAEGARAIAKDHYRVALIADLLGVGASGGSEDGGGSDAGGPVEVVLGGANVAQINRMLLRGPHDDDDAAVAEADADAESPASDDLVNAALGEGSSEEGAPAGAPAVRAGGDVAINALKNWRATMRGVKQLISAIKDYDKSNARVRLQRIASEAQVQRALERASFEPSSSSEALKKRTVSYNAFTVRSAIFALEEALERLVFVDGRAGDLAKRARSFLQYLNLGLQTRRVVVLAPRDRG